MMMQIQQWMLPVRKSHSRDMRGPNDVSHSELQRQISDKEQMKWCDQIESVYMCSLSCRVVERIYST